MMPSHITTHLRATWMMTMSLLAFASQATNYYADSSAAGSMGNVGTAASPWANLSSIFAANKTFLAGDTIFLRNGNHGYAIIKGVQADFVVIAPAPARSHH